MKLKLKSMRVYEPATENYGGGMTYANPLTGRRTYAGGALCAIAKGKAEGYHGLTSEETIAEAMKIESLSREEVLSATW